MMKKEERKIKTKFDWEYVFYSTILILSIDLYRDMPQSGVWWLNILVWYIPYLFVVNYVRKKAIQTFKEKEIARGTYMEHRVFENEQDKIKEFLIHIQENQAELKALGVELELTLEGIQRRNEEP